ncbi:UvrD-helicase domain-containing protein [Marinilactibacillus psychrotolerans]|uniref:UvrD-helicase domain-containing protein n=1 Tax=Marinilactibacillus psychrotolerans TaxID=191770 RepID=A0ABW8UH95_9LACT
MNKLINKLILAPAGGRKTQTIVDNCLLGDTSANRLIVTFTTTGQKVIQERVWKNKSNIGKLEISGWYAFLLNHIIYPYVYDKYPKQTVKGFHFVEGKNPSRYRKGSKRYFDDEGKVYSSNIGKLAHDVAVASNGAWIDRLERIYDEIYFDEVQDLAGNDLDILKMLFQSNITIICVGDVRQTIYSTNRTDTKYKNYRGLQKILWYKEMESLGLCEIEERTKTWRCNQDVIDFADSVLPKELEFPATKSMNINKTEHDGIFLISWDNLTTYINTFKPTCYRNRVDSLILEGTIATNFGQCKGETVPRVLIYPTKPIKSFLKDSTNQLKNQSASSFYVAITRAIHSVAIVVEKPNQYNIQEWVPR